MPSKHVSFSGHGGDNLSARLDLPDGPHLATAVFAHCFTCSKDLHAARRISARLAGLGIAVLRFDFTGLGHSGGEFANTTFSSNVEDLVAAAHYLEAEGFAPALMIGHSLGGAAVLRAAPRIDSIAAVVTIGAPYDPSHVTEAFGEAVPDIRDKGSAEVTLAGRSFRIGKAFLDDIAAQNLRESIRALDAALLVLHAPRDETVGIDNAGEIFRAARHPKSFVTLDDADHLISDAADADYAAGVIAAWVRKYIDLPEPPRPAAAPEGVIRVSEADPDGFLQDIQSGPDHYLQADEPVSVGGTNRGLSPYGLLSAGLGACTSMTLRMYARRKGWPLSHVSVDVSHAKSHIEDSLDSAKIDVFHRVIRLQGDLDETQRERLLQIADKCPVHKTLEAEAKVVTQLLD
jgi:putative redox protein